ncbi:MAG: alpha-galactosidase [Verrucomicrobiaceae bacterium]|nr:MAG: alpha-galactosidase [Verrucomicrobiaceae bacterium]
MNGETGLREAGEKCRSSGVMGWTNGGGSRAVVAGFLDHSTSNTRLEAVHFAGGEWRVTATIFREGIELAPGGTLEASQFWLQTGPELSALLEQYADSVAGTMGKRKKKSAESGWCSWYHYYGKETFDDVVSCATELAASPAAAFLRTVQIDDGWNRAATANLPEAWGDWEAHPDKFPSGMAEAARRIHEMGFRAGLWLAPLAVARESRFFQEHADWLVQQRDPETGETSPAPTDNPDVFSLDCTHPQAIAWLRETFRRVFREWNFDYVKIDFLHYGAREGIRHDPAATSIEAYRRGLEAINCEAGPGKFILGCGAPLLASVGLVDGMRVACDVGGRWLFDPGWPDWPVGNCSIRAAAIPSLWSQWMHGRWWQNDPDCLVVRDSSPSYERAFFERLEKETAIKNPGYITTAPGLTPEEAGLWTRLVWMTGGMAFLSEVWSGLPADRRDMLMKCFPAHGRKVSVLDWFGMPDAAVLVARGRPSLCAIFHFGDSVLRPEISAKKLGLSRSWTLRERWSGEELHGNGAVVVFPEMPPHSGRIWEKV